MRGLSVAEQGFRFIWDCFVKYQGTWAYLLLGALAVVLVLLYRKKEAAFLFLWYPLVLLKDFHQRFSGFHPVSAA